MKPFTKWVGGKRQLLPALLSEAPDSYRKYFEPFVGGALFLELAPASAAINDSNTELILAYQSIKDDIEGLITGLKHHAASNSKEHYLTLRAADRTGTLEHMISTQRAARLIYMLRVNFNGLYRVNSKNQFNVPYGKYANPTILDEENLRRISAYLNTNDVTITNGSFQEAVQAAEANDFIYFDPPYIPLSATESFTSYTPDGFGLDEQLRLRDVFIDLSERGVKVLLSNSLKPPHGHGGSLLATTDNSSCFEEYYRDLALLSLFDRGKHPQALILG